MIELLIIIISLQVCILVGAVMVFIKCNPVPHHVQAQEEEKKDNKSYDPNSAEKKDWDSF